MRITFDLNPVKPTELYDELYRGSFYGRLSYFYLPGIVYLAIFPITFYVLPWESLAQAAAGILLSGLLTDKIVDFYTREAKNRFTIDLLDSLGSGSKRILLGRQTIEVTDQSIRVSYESYDGTYVWSNVERIINSHLYGFIELIDGTIIAVPKIFPTVDNVSVFLSDARRFFRRSNRNQRTELA